MGNASSEELSIGLAIFHDRWGWWPLEGWLTAFAELGLAPLRR